MSFSSILELHAIQSTVLHCLFICLFSSIKVEKEDDDPYTSLRTPSSSTITQSSIETAAESASETTESQLTNHVPPPIVTLALADIPGMSNPIQGTTLRDTTMESQLAANPIVTSSSVCPSIVSSHDVSMDMGNVNESELTIDENAVNRTHNMSIESTGDGNETSHNNSFSEANGEFNLYIE